MPFLTSKTVWKIAVAFAVMLTPITAVKAPAQTSSPPEQIIATSFTDKSFVRRLDHIELRLSRPLGDSDERVAVLIGTTDAASLVMQDKLTLRYNADAWPLLAGESTLPVYLVSPQNEWKEIGRMVLQVATGEAATDESRNEDESGWRSNFVKAHYSGPAVRAVQDEWIAAFAASLASAQSPAAPVAGAANGKTESKHRRIKFTPSLTLTVPSQPAQSTSPGPQPERATFIQVNMQASIRNEAEYGIFHTQSSFDFAGSSFQNEALRFGTEGKAAPQIDLSSYLFQVQIGKVKYQMGHFSYGTQRQLINGFSSRGLEVTVPFLQRFDFSVAAMNGTQLVGYDNFFGLSRSKHQMLSGTLGIEFIRKRPGGLRVEVGVLNAYFQPVSGINRGVITDVQRSRGLALRVIANDKAGRFHLDGGF